MTEFYKAELKDKFLSFALKRDDYFETTLLYEEFLKPNYSKSVVEKLVKEIMDHDANLIDAISGNGSKIFMISGTPYITDFLEEGGFKDRYVKEEEKWDSLLGHFSFKKTPKETSMVSGAKLQNSSSKKEKILLLGLLFAILFSFAYTLFGMVNSFFKPDYITHEEMNSFVKELQIEHQREKELLLREINALKFDKVTNLREIP